ncbi:MAG: toll/interleukin-1 receptor domain-containing protein [Planctomycetes bacterium]|nr:toll/interleukin-1 receptor domain-containing protein [Planctomycetota bacterium]
MSWRRLQSVLVAMLTLVLSGCGVDSQGKMTFAGLGTLEACICLGLTVPIIAVVVIGVLWLIFKARPKARPKVAAAAAAPDLHIFVSYRRSDSQDVSGRIYDVLTARFSKACVFKDVDSIPLGRDFRKVLQQAVSRAQVVIVIIGPGWARAKTAAGTRRLDDPNDFVRIEIESALQSGIPVIPVMVSHAKMAGATDLPASLQELAFQNGLPVRPDPDFHRDMARLIAALETIAPGAAPVESADADVPQSSRGIGLWLGGCGAAVVFLIIAIIALGVLAYIGTVMLGR